MLETSVSKMINVIFIHPYSSTSLFVICKLRLCVAKWVTKCRLHPYMVVRWNFFLWLIAQKTLLIMLYLIYYQTLRYTIFTRDI